LFRRGLVFPDYFYTFLHDFVATISDPSNAARNPSNLMAVPVSQQVVVSDVDWKLERIHSDFSLIATAVDIPNVDTGEISPNPAEDLGKAKLEDSGRCYTIACNASHSRNVF
jgi:hypothetical protein